MTQKNHLYLCPVGEALAVFAGRWKPEILWHLQHGPKRFNQLRRDIGGVSQKMLTQQLRDLQRDGLVIRKQYPEIPPRVEYHTTPLAKSLETIFSQLVTWGETNANQIAAAQRRFDDVQV